MVLIYWTIISIWHDVFVPGTKDLGSDLRIRNGVYERNLPELNVLQSRLSTQTV